MMRVFSVLLAALLCCAAPRFVRAGDLPAELYGALHALADAGGFSADFDQVIRFQDGSVQKYGGKVDVATPGRFRWRYEKPFVQLFVSDGFKIWHYEPDLMQVTVMREMPDVDPAVMRLLEGSLGLRDVHLLAADAAAHRYHVRIGGKTDAWIGVRNGRLAYIERLDALGNHNRITLTHLRLRAPDAGRFAFVVPQGVDVVSMRQ